MHAREREDLILRLLAARGFVSFRDLERQLDGSAATVRRDLERLAREGRLVRVRGGIKSYDDGTGHGAVPRLNGAPFHENITRNATQKAAIGRAAAQLCAPAESIMIDGGSTTLQMCPHLAGLKLQVLTNSLHIVAALLGQAGTHVLVPSGTVFPEQNIILSAVGDDGLPRLHAPKLFMGAASVGPAGLMQSDVILVAAERRLIERADMVILLADSSKFCAATGNIVCGLGEIDTLITDGSLSHAHRDMLVSHGIEVIIAH